MSAALPLVLVRFAWEKGPSPQHDPLKGLFFTGDSAVTGTSEQTKLGETSIFFSSRFQSHR